MGLGDKILNAILPRTEPQQPTDLLGNLFSEAAAPSDVGKMTFQGIRMVGENKDTPGEPMARFHIYQGNGRHSVLNLEENGLREYLHHMNPVSPDIDRFNQGQVAMAQQALQNFDFVGASIDWMGRNDPTPVSAAPASAPAAQRSAPAAPATANSTNGPAYDYTDPAQAAAAAVETVRKFQTVQNGPSFTPS